MYKSMKGELVSFQAKDGIILHGFLARSKRKSKKAVVHIHGLMGSFYRSHLSKVLARKLVANGFNFLSIELRGSYTSMGLRRKKGKKLQWVLGGGGFERFEDCVYDIGGAIRFLGSMGVNKIYLEGHSTGCQKITYYQYKKRDRRVRALILLAPVDDYNVQRKELGRRFKKVVEDANRLYKKDRDAQLQTLNVIGGFSAGRFLSFSDLRFVESRIFNYELPKLKEFGAIRQPVLVMFGSKDDALMPVKDYMEILRRNATSRMFGGLIINDADHGFSGKENKTANIIVDWLKEIE